MCEMKRGTEGTCGGVDGARGCGEVRRFRVHK